MERVRMVGDFELVYEKEMNMFRFIKTGTEDFSAWFSPEKAEEFKVMKDDDLFKTAEKSVQRSGKTE